MRSKFPCLDKKHSILEFLMNPNGHTCHLSYIVSLFKNKKMKFFKNSIENLINVYKPYVIISYILTSSFSAQVRIIRGRRIGDGTCRPLINMTPFFRFSNQCLEVDLINIILKLIIAIVNLTPSE